MISSILSNNKQKPQQCFLEKKLQSLVKKTFLENLAEVANGRLTGFIKARVEAGQKQFLEYPSKSFEILEKLYEKENLLIEQREAKQARRQKQIKQSSAPKPAGAKSGTKLMDLIKEIGGRAPPQAVAQAPPAAAAVKPVPQAQASEAKFKEVKNFVKEFGRAATPEEQARVAAAHEQMKPKLYAQTGEYLTQEKNQRQQPRPEQDKKK